MRTSYKQLALEYQDRFCAAVADYKRKNELRLFYEKENKQLKEKLKTVTDAADSTMCHMQYYEKQCNELEKEIAELKEKRDYYKDMADTANKVYNENLDYSWYLEGQLTEAKEIILKLYNAGRDVLMCRTEEKAYENLSHAINDKEIEQFLNSLLSNF